MYAVTVRHLSALERLSIALSWFCCRYVVRVVPTHKDTNVDWKTENDATTGNEVVTTGHFREIYNPLASQAMRIYCDKPCLVMLYNTGRVYEDDQFNKAHWFLRATTYAVSAQRRICYRNSVRPSVRLSVTRVDQSKTVQVRIMQFSPHSSHIPLVFVR